MSRHCRCCNPCQVRCEPIACAKAKTPELFGTKLFGCREIPPINTVASGFAVTVLSNNESELDYIIQTTGLTNITSAGFYEGKRGQNGVLVKSIIIDPISGTAIGAWKSTDPQPLTPNLINKLRNDQIYINITTAQNPNGEIRGNIHKVPIE